MSEKTLSTFDREVQDNKLYESFEKGYREFSLSKILMGLMKESHKTVQGLAHEIGLSTSVIQKVRSGEQQDLKISTFPTITEACGYHLCLEKVETLMTIKPQIKVIRRDNAAQGIFLGNSLHKLSTMNLKPCYCQTVNNCLIKLLFVPK